MNARQDKPTRVQLSRRHKLPPNTVSVARPGRWGNPFKVEDYGRENAVARFRQFVANGPTFHGRPLDVRELRGKNLACFCKPGELCHADVLLEFANRPQPSANALPALRP